MSKVEKTVYTCDRCGKVIAATPYSVSTARFIRVLKWWMSQEYKSKEYHLCDECWQAFRCFLRGDGDV